jgi:hypothetical protein
MGLSADEADDAVRELAKGVGEIRTESAGIK